ncbi:MAG TPA: diguanylate cyclase [Burkholderiaceae bacterium]
MSESRSGSGGSGVFSSDVLVRACLQSSNAMFVAERNGRIVWVNDAFCTLSGYALDEVLGAAPSLVKSDMQSALFYAELWRTILAGSAWRGRITNRRKGGGYYVVDQVISPVAEADGAITHFLSIQQEVAALHEERDREHYLAYHDLLTGLPNRAFFVDLQRQALSYAKREGEEVAMFFLDLDGFKAINDLHGHEAGDALLQAVAQRLTAAVRKSDTVARLGGDEFAILLPELRGADTAPLLAQKLVDAVASPFLIKGRELRIRVSVGVAFFPRDASDGASLTAHSDGAMYEAKREGGGRFRIFSAP